MARGTKKPVQKPPAKSGNWTTFVEISLAGHSLEDISNAFGSSDKLFEAIETMARDGYRISVSYNERNDAVIASVTCKDDASGNSDCTFTSFASDWVTALQVAAYKHYIVTEQDWTAKGEVSSRPAFG